MTIYTIVEYETIENGIRKTRTRYTPIGVADLDRSGFMRIRLKADGSFSVNLTLDQRS